MIVKTLEFSSRGGLIMDMKIPWTILATSKMVSIDFGELPGYSTRTRIVGARIAARDHPTL